MNAMTIYTFGRENSAGIDGFAAISSFLDHLSNFYPAYMHQPERLREILESFREKQCVSAIIEPDYVDKQYRDSYYGYFAQKYNAIGRNCLRLTFFEGSVTDEDFMSPDPSELGRRFIGIVVLRPLHVGAIGKTLIDPKKVNVTGEIKTCKFKSAVAGVKFKYRAFPFSSQDNETMTCAETSLYNLIVYYGRKYPDYRVLMPTEILQEIQSNYYERVLPSHGLEIEYIAKILLDTHFYPRLYMDIKNFDEILHIYVESGVPFILGLPGHVVNCIGRGPIDRRLEHHTLEAAVCRKDLRGGVQHYLSTAALTDEYIVMDDNKAPYSRVTLKNITREYYEHMERSDVAISQQATQKKTEPEIEKLIADYDSLIVPLYRRVYIDAPKAKNVFITYFLENPAFLEAIRSAYEDPTWGNALTNPFVWRMYLTTSKKYRDFKIRHAGTPEIAAHYMYNTFPHFIWVMEIGTTESLAGELARVEVILDASSSVHSESRSILSVAYKGHSAFFPAITEETLVEVEKHMAQDRLRAIPAGKNVGFTMMCDSK